MDAATARFQKARKNRKFTEHTLAKRQASLAQCQTVERSLNNLLAAFNIPWQFNFENPEIENNLKYFYFEVARPGKIGETEEMWVARVARIQQAQQQQQQQQQARVVEAQNRARKARRAKKSAHLKKRAARKAFFAEKLEFY